ncbi:MAG TPA: hypothetical protein PKI11_13890 [Candidatus Hydrogenedentes bacterium]|nr:hypothetical protein [Candidatus Hydrogenedentota bacterium]HNT89803.1 hypothetical protein [Candidatus Hydrogenedentota bacterium]
MKKKHEEMTDDLRPEYDAALIRGGVRGKYARRFPPGSSVVVLPPDVASAFPDSESVSEALRLLIRIARMKNPKSRRRTSSM